METAIYSRSNMPTAGLNSVLLFTHPKWREERSAMTSGSSSALAWLEEQTKTITNNPSDYVLWIVQPGVQAGTPTQDIEIALLEQSAQQADDAAFLQIAGQIDWSARPSQDYVYAVRLALEAGAHGFARQLSQEGGRRFPDSTEIQQLANLLAPTQVVKTHLPANPDADANLLWLKNNRDDYFGQWVALRDGHLVSVAPTARDLRAQLEDPKDKTILITAVY
jgi:hypothetical protein